MNYIVNKETKEHRVRQGVTPNGWYEVEADSNGWIRKAGSKCPLPWGEDHEVIHDGDMVPGDQPQTWRWGDHLLTHYRPACYHEQKEGGVEWKGEGLPPVGTECECDHEGSAQGRVRVMFMGEEFCVLQNMDEPREQCGKIKDYDFRPILTPEQRAVDEMADVVEGIYNRDDVISAIYTAIREGRIPGVKLDK